MSAAPGTLPATEIGERGPTAAYTIATLVTDHEEYRQMVAALEAAGFGRADCEYLYADNSRGNRYDAFTAYNRFLVEARGRRVILCHQDILPLADGRAALDARLEELDRLDPHWGVCGNAGRTAAGQPAIRISDPHRADTALGGPYPVRVMSLDENFMVVRREANLALSRDLAGFHWYGTDLAVVADVLGYGAYVIDFHLLHKSGGNPDAGFFTTREQLRQKYSRAFRTRLHHSSVNRVFLSGSPLQHARDKVLHGLERRLAPLLERLGLSRKG